MWVVMKWQSWNDWSCESVEDTKEKAVSVADVVVDKWVEDAVDMWESDVQATGEADCKSVTRWTDPNDVWGVVKVCKVNV